jgi:hypothetical protein
MIDLSIEAYSKAFFFLNYSFKSKHWLHNIDVHIKNHHHHMNYFNLNYFFLSLKYILYKIYLYKF